MKKSYHHIVII